MKKLIIIISFLALISACNEEKKTTTQVVTATYNSQSTPTAVPEPSTMLLLGLGLIGLAGARRKFKN